MKGRVLIIAGSDSGGGAGIQADIKTVTALGGFAMTAITAITAQNTLGVSAVHEIPPSIVAEQIKVTMDDLGADCIKVGMLSNPRIIDIVYKTLQQEVPKIPIILDPVMVAKGGASLLTNEAVESLKELLLPKAFLLTPNIPEAIALTQLEGHLTNDTELLLSVLLGMGSNAVLLKGGHRESDLIVDFLHEHGRNIKRFENPRIPSKDTHGTGCTLASAIATGIAQSLTLEDSVIRARKYVYEAIMSAPGLGGGHGPLNHGYLIPNY
ncbi:MAG: bifunctional hydroxymethylpyrimidine kinase/phosphomethylpyrimidine kinase [Rhodospirillales bacterium]|nr:bifunctional hydroxymethylpyrimidine kinase/phosphomethylpyrimidine kinase [Rhodospirillales bacterium]